MTYPKYIFFLYDLNNIIAAIWQIVTVLPEIYSSHSGGGANV